MQCNDVRNHFADYVNEQLPQSVQAELAQHLKECVMCALELDGLTDVWIRMGAIPSAESPVVAMNARFKNVLDVVKEVRPVERRRRWILPTLVAASVVLVFLLSGLLPKNSVDSFAATVEAADGALYKAGTLLNVGARIDRGEEIRAERGAMLALADGSRVEMRSGSQIALESAADGVRIRLDSGSVLVNAAKQHGHLYVQTKDVTVAVVGTVFLVNAEETGSRVAVIEGEVSVRQGANAQSLLPGEQVATASAMLPIKVKEEISWSRNAPEHVALLARLEQAAAPATQAIEPKPAVPEFDVAAIHPSAPDSTFMRFDDKNERVTMENATLKSIIRYAYNVREFQISGPELLNNRYTIQAKAPAGTPNEQLRPMLQPLLEKRFKMVARREMKETQVYALTVATPGKLKELSPTETLSGGGAGGPGLIGIPGVATSRSSGPLSSFVDSLSRSLPLPVVDRTGLTGRYEITLQYVPERVREQGDSSGPSIFQALDVYGLKLEKIRASIEFLVIDHVEPPTEN
jgi:uncharacterized protein (TIGR03435 family)